MNLQKVRDDIKALSERKFKLVAKAEREGRQMTVNEQLICDELTGAIDGLKAELEKPGDRLTIPGGNRTLGVTGPFGSFGEQLLAIRDAGTPGGRVDQRLFEIRGAAGLGESVPSDGGFLLQPTFSNELLTGVWNLSLIAPRCRKITVGPNSNSVKLNAFDETSRASTRFGGILAYWVDEAVEKTASKPKFRQMELSLKKLIGLCYLTDELIQDVSVFEQVVRDAFISEINFRLDDAIINGTGAGQPLGIVNSPCLVGITKESGQDADTVVTENIIKMFARLMPGSEKTACWICNKNVLPQLFQMSLAVGVGGSSVFLPAGGLSGQPYNTLLGLPVFTSEVMPTLGDKGDIILADFANGYVLATKGGVQVDMSIHVRYVYDESCLRLVFRCDGQPTLASAVTPYKGSSFSYFIAINERA